VCRPREIRGLAAENHRVANSRRATKDAMSRATFAELYCARHGLAPDAYQQAVFRRVLYPHARPLAWLLPLLDRDYFAADLDLVRAAGLARKLGEYANDAEEFVHHPANRGALRRVLRLRVSARRLRALLREVLPASGSAPPFPAPPDCPPA
jgi:hypothetical protein